MFYQRDCTERTYRNDAGISCDGDGTGMTTKIVIGNLVLVSVGEPSNLIPPTLIVLGLALREPLFSDFMRHAA